MIYRVRARFRTEKALEFYQKLTNGTISNQQPDGREMVASMQRAKITASGEVEWYEMCFCSTPLAHECTTVYNHYFEDLTTEPAIDYGEVNGDSFWTWLSLAIDKPV